MRVDQHGKHAQRFVVLDKSHPAHIGREIVDLFNAPGRVAAGVHVAQIQLQILRLVRSKEPLVQRFAINGAHRNAAFHEVAGQLTTDEAAGPCHQC
jgi:hypothetical protein